MCISAACQPEVESNTTVDLLPHLRSDDQQLKIDRSIIRTLRSYQSEFLLFFCGRHCRLHGDDEVDDDDDDGCHDDASYRRPIKFHLASSS